MNSANRGKFFVSSASKRTTDCPKRRLQQHRKRWLAELNWPAVRDASLRDPYESTLSARIHEPSFRKLVGDPLVAKSRIIKDLGKCGSA